jgi:hypothetical protein
MCAARGQRLVTASELQLQRRTIVMRKLGPWATFLFVCSLSTAAFAANGKLKDHSPKIARSDSGLTAPSNASAEAVVRGYLKRSDDSL